MASLLSWLGNATRDIFDANTVADQKRRLAAGQPRYYQQQKPNAPSNLLGQVVQHGQAAVAQANPLDGKRTYNTVRQQGADFAPNPVASVLNQVTHNGITNAAGDLVHGIVDQAAALPKSLYGIGRIGVADLTGNKIAAKNARNYTDIQEGKFFQPIARPLAQAAITIHHPFEQYTAQPKGHTQQVLLGDTPVQNIQAGVASTYQNRTDLPLPQRVITAGAYGLGQAAQDALAFQGAKAAVKPSVDTAVKTTAKAAEPVVQRAKDLGLKRPTPLTDPELLASQKVLAARSGQVSPMDITSQEAQLFHNAQVKLGVKPGTPQGFSAVDQALGAHRTFETQLQQRAQAIREAKQRLAVNNEIGAVGKNVQSELPTQLPIKPVETAKTAPAGISRKQTVSRDKLGSQGVPFTSKNTPVAPNSQFNTAEYVKQQTKLQEAARKQGDAGKLIQFKQEFKKKLVDSMAPIEDTLNKAVKNGAQIAPEHNIKYQIDRAIRADTIGAQYMKDHGLATVIQNVPDTKAFDQYLIAKHAQDLAKNGIKTGRNAAADQQLIKSLAPTYEAHAKALTQYNQKLLDEAVNYGLVSKETATALKKKYPNYVPANRIFGSNELTTYKGTGAGKASISSQGVVKKIKGSERQIESPLASIINKTQQVVKEGERNKAAQILASYKDLPGNPFGLRELKPSETVGTTPTVSFLDKGKQRRFETTPEIAAAAKSLNPVQLGLLGKIFSYPTRLLRLGATSLNPAFAGANVVKDVASGIINSKHPVNSSIANPSVFLDALKAVVNHDSKQYGELVRQGAGGTSFDIAREAPRQNVARIRAQRNAPTKIAYTVTHPAQLFRAAENAIGRSEEFTRALQYFGNKDAFLKAGNTAEQAKILGADAARNNTVNFARAGEYGRVLNSVLPYLNAGIQGSRTLLRNLKDRPVQTGAKIAVVGFLPVAATTAWNISDPNRRAAYNDISEYEKQNNIIIIPPNPYKDPKTGRWNVIKIPVSQEIANLNDVVRRGVEAAQKDTKFNFAAMVGDLVGTGTSLNAQNGRQLIGQVTPQAIKPAIETLVNQNLYSGNQLVPDSMKNLPGKLQVSPYTSGTSQVLGNLTGQSPIKIDNAISTSLGGLGQNIVNLSDKALAKTGVIRPDQVRGKSFIDAASQRFNSAQAKSPSTYANDAYKKASTELMKSPEFKNAPTDVKARALNRLSTDSKALAYAAYDAQNGTGPYAQNAGSAGAKLTKNQKALGDGSLKPTDYIGLANGSKSSVTSTSSDASPADKYKTALANYQTNSKTMTDVQKYAAEKGLATLKVQAPFPSDVIKLYGMSKADAYQFLTTNKNGKKLADQLIAYDKARYNAGLSKYMKYDNGIAPATKKGRSGKGRGGSRSRGAPKANLSTILTTLKSTNTTTSPIKAPSKPNITVKTNKLPAKYRQTALKQYKVTGPRVPKIA